MLILVSKLYKAITYMKCSRIFSLLLMLTTPYAVGIEVNPELCFDNGWSKDKLITLKQSGFVTTEKETHGLLQQLQHCLAVRDPQIRDGVAYEAYLNWLRAGKVSGAQLVAVFDKMTTALESDNPDENGVYLPFVALVYSEVVRVDRVDSFLTDEQRQRAVSSISKYLSKIKDYRGFEDGAGWRHSVAHSADVVLQLALNQKITGEQLKQLSHSIASQINPNTLHFYIFGEPERLARAVTYAMLREEVDLKYWDTWLTEVASPKPFKGWGSVFVSESGLAKRNNVRQFLTNLYAMTSNSKNERLSHISPFIAKLISNTN